MPVILISDSFKNKVTLPLVELRPSACVSMLTLDSKGQYIYFCR